MAFWTITTKNAALHADIELRYLPRDEIKAFRADLHFIGRNISNYAFDFAEGHEWVENWAKHADDGEELLYRVDYSVAYKANYGACLTALRKLFEDYGLEDKQFKMWVELEGGLERRPFGFIFNDDDDESTPF